MPSRLSECDGRLSVGSTRHPEPLRLKTLRPDLHLKVTATMVGFAYAFSKCMRVEDRVGGRPRVISTGFGDFSVVVKVLVGLGRRIPRAGWVRP